MGTMFFLLYEFAIYVVNKQCDKILAQPNNSK